ncbi:hypothetical protein L3Q82_016216, partial [Scortum barcoo]
MGMVEFCEIVTMLKKPNLNPLTLSNYQPISKISIL